MQLVGLIRIALREPKFEFRGRAGETGNPLFRGFGDQSREEVERYDQPVLTRLNTRDELELRGGFPRTPEDLFAYDAIILDDVEAAFFGADQAALFPRFVAERGGGFLMLGGAESFQEGGYHRTPIGDLLPVYLDRPDTANPGGPQRFSLAREGWLQAWARLRDNEGDERARLENVPPFLVFNRVRDVKPGASVIALATDEDGHNRPALVTQRFGRGRSAALLLGDLWRWGMRDTEARRDMEKAWRQLIRWLVADVPKRVELSIEEQPAAGSGAVQLQIRVRDPAFLPLDDATVSLEVEPVPAAGSSTVTNRIRMRAEPSLSEAGLYTAAFLPRDSGAYKALAVAENAAGGEIGRAEAGWSTDLAAEEFRSLQPNTALLEAIARRTGGGDRDTGQPAVLCPQPAHASSPGHGSGDRPAVAHPLALPARPGLLRCRMGPAPSERNALMQENHVASPIPDVRNRRRIQSGKSLHRFRTSGMGLREAPLEPCTKSGGEPPHSRRLAMGGARPFRAERLECVRFAGAFRFMAAEQVHMEQNDSLELCPLSFDLRPPSSSAPPAPGPLTESKGNRRLSVLLALALVPFSSLPVASEAEPSPPPPAAPAELPAILLVVGAPGEPEFGTNFLHQAESWTRVAAQAQIP
ncbi:MAG: glutamine amidotransferase [Verrucomicrobia bacterium]|nr:glutamine amidotransferase [Verrucomicrobiota bacterium]